MSLPPPLFKSAYDSMRVLLTANDESCITSPNSDAGFGHLGSPRCQPVTVPAGISPSPTPCPCHHINKGGQSSSRGIKVLEEAKSIDDRLFLRFPGKEIQLIQFCRDW